MNQVFLIAPKEHSLKENIVAFEKPSMFSMPKNYVMRIYTKRIAENIGVGAIANYLRTHGISTKCINLSIEDKTINDIVQDVMLEKPLIVGLSMLYDLHVINAMEIIIALRKGGYKGHITLGGTFISLAYERFIKSFDVFDSIIVGDGEKVFLNLYSALLEGENLSCVSGLATLDENGEINYSPQDCHEGSIIATPDRDGFDYLTSKNMHVSAALIVGSRGCNNNCLYCSAPNMRKYHNKIWKGREAKEIVREIENLIKNYNIKYLYFCDDNFCGYGDIGLKHIREFVSEMKKEKLSIPFHAEIRADADITKADILELKSVGLDEALIGIESGVQSCLQRWKKNITIEQNKEIIKQLKLCNVKIAPAYILFDPFTTFDEYKQSVDFIRNNKLYHMDNPWYLFNQMIAYPGTELEEMLIERGIISKTIIRRYTLEELDNTDVLLSAIKGVSSIEYEIVDYRVRIIWMILREHVDEIVEIVCTKIPSLSLKQIRNRENTSHFLFRLGEWRKNLGTLLMNYMDFSVWWGGNSDDIQVLQSGLQEIRARYDQQHLGDEFFFQI